MSYGTFSTSSPVDAPSSGDAAPHHWALLLLIEIAISALSTFLILVTLLPLLGQKVAPARVLEVSLGFTCLVFFVLEPAAALLWSYNLPERSLDPQRLEDAEAGAVAEKVAVGAT
ncbi:hypothetical protein FB451DRAFT_1394812 [Mycena latifolia]|nr:hypothetical protein FB451DRAFT_1394812 [Mycena latifolia]